MGAHLITIVHTRWTHVSDRAFRILSKMALTALDTASGSTPAGLYFGGADALAMSLRPAWPVGEDPAAARSRARLRRVASEAITELVRAGAITRAIDHAHPGRRMSYWVLQELGVEAGVPVPDPDPVQDRDGDAQGPGIEDPDSGSRFPGPSPANGSRIPGTDGSRIPGTSPTDGSRIPGTSPTDGSRIPGPLGTTTPRITTYEELQDEIGSTRSVSHSRARETPPDRSFSAKSDLGGLPASHERDSRESLVRPQRSAPMSELDACPACDVYLDPGGICGHRLCELYGRRAA